MTDWRPITPFEPEGSGTVLIWCARTSWVRTAAASAIREDNIDGIYAIEGYEYARFAYIDHPYCVPEQHPYHELLLMDSGGEAEHSMLASTIGERADSYGEFIQRNDLRYFSGQINSHLHWMCDANYRFLFKTKEERLLAEIALAGKRA
jgi:hypothetical protein